MQIRSILMACLAGLALHAPQTYAQVEDDDSDAQETGCTAVGVAVGGAVVGGAIGNAPGALGGSLSALIGWASGVSSAYVCNEAVDAARESFETTMQDLGFQFTWGHPGIGWPQIPATICLHHDPFACTPNPDPTQNYTLAQQNFMRDSWSSIGLTLTDLAVGGDANVVSFGAMDFANSVSYSFNTFGVEGALSTTTSIMGDP